MFDPIVYRSKSGDIVEVSNHGDSLRFTIKGSADDASNRSFPITWEDWETLVKIINAQKP
jgi:hypothetical protein